MLTGNGGVSEHSMLGLSFAGVLLVLPVLAQTSVSGSFVYPDGTVFTGTVVVQLTKPTVTNTCGTAVQAMTFRPVRVKVAAGTMPATNIYASNCLQNGTSGVATAVVLSGAGSGASASVTGSWYGSLSVTAGTGAVAGTSAVRAALTIPPFLTCYLQTLNANAVAAAARYTDVASAWINAATPNRYLTLIPSIALTGGQTYQWSYSCIQPYQVNVYDPANTLLYTAQWAVPIGASADVAQADLSEIVVVSK